MKMKLIRAPQRFAIACIAPSSSSTTAMRTKRPLTKFLLQIAWLWLLACPYKTIQAQRTMPGIANIITPTLKLAVNPIIAVVMRASSNTMGVSAAAIPISTPTPPPPSPSPPPAAATEKSTDCNDTIELLIGMGDDVLSSTVSLPCKPNTTEFTNEADNVSAAIAMSNHEYCLSTRNSIAEFFPIVLYTLVCVIGLFGNTLVIYVVLRYSKMQTVTNIYILNLAIADECFLIGIPFLIYTMRICSWTFGEYVCKAYMVSTSVTQFTSSIFLVIMSADRYLAVCHPIASPRYRTLRIAKLVSAIAWLTSVILMMPVILFASQVQQQDGIHLSCNIDWPEQYQKHSGTTFILYNFVLGFATPLCFILAFYCMVIRKLHSVGPQQKSKKKKHTHRKVTRLVLTVITVYILCWLPHWISQVALINSNPGQRDLSRLEVLVFLLFGCLQYSNSAMNPILYAFLSHNFRKSFSKAFTCMARQEVNAQLNVEPSVLTKQLSRRRAGSKRLLAMVTPGEHGNDGSRRAGVAVNVGYGTNTATVQPQFQQPPQGNTNKANEQQTQNRTQYLMPPAPQHCIVTLNMSRQPNSSSGGTSCSMAANAHGGGGGGLSAGGGNISGGGSSSGGGISGASTNNGSSSTTNSNCTNTSTATQATATTILLNHEQQAVCTLKQERPQQQTPHQQQPLLKQTDV